MSISSARGKRHCRFFSVSAPSLLPGACKVPVQDVLLRLIPLRVISLPDRERVVPASPFLTFGGNRGRVTEGPLCRTDEAVRLKQPRDSWPRSLKSDWGLFHFAVRIRCASQRRGPLIRVEC